MYDVGFNDNMNSDRKNNRLIRNDTTSVIQTFLYWGGAVGPGRVQLLKNNTAKLCCLAFVVKLGREIVST